MDYITVTTVTTTTVTTPTPGSKSITNRALLMAAMADGTSRLIGALKSNDTHHMSTALRQMGISISYSAALLVNGHGYLDQPPAALFLGNAGTVMRFLTAAATTVAGKVVLYGDDYMKNRPISPLLSALSGIDAFSTRGCPPVTIIGEGSVRSCSLEIDASLSSQYVSAILLISACGKVPIEIVLRGKDIGARGYIALTIYAMRAFGANFSTLDSRHWRVLPTGYAATDYLIEPDASAATYLWAANAITNGSIDSSDSSAQPDAAAHAFIPAMTDLIDGAQMQDAIPTLAILSSGLYSNRVRFTGLANLRVKECDRVAAMHNGLNAISSGLAKVEDNDLIVHPDPEQIDTFIDTYADHRIAMCFALAGLKVHGLRIINPDCVYKTFPAYWETLSALGCKIVCGYALI